MGLTLRPKSKLGKISAWGIIYYLISWIVVAWLQPRFGGDIGDPNFFDWLMILLALTGMLGAFISLIGNLLAIVWREDRSLLGILTFVISVPIAIFLVGFLLVGFVS